MSDPHEPPHRGLLTRGLEGLRLVAGWSVVVAWVAAIIADVVVPGYDPPDSIHVLMLVVVTALFAPTIIGRRNGKDE